MLLICGVVGYDMAVPHALEEHPADAFEMLVIT